jgi:hypothetical protein
MGFRPISREARRSLDSRVMEQIASERKLSRKPNWAQSQGVG